MPPLPAYSDEELAGLGAPDLWRLLIRDEDRVPRAVIDECVRRGDAILDEIENVLRKDYYWSDDMAAGEWWLPVHAAMVLGLSPGERAGGLLLEYMLRLGVPDEYDRGEWLSEYWPALFLNKPPAVLAHVRAVADDATVAVHARAIAVDCVLAHAQKHDPAELDGALAWAGGIAFRKDEDFDLRSLVGCTLINFARPGHRRGLELLADRQRRKMRWFGRGEIEHAYAQGGDEHEWERFEDPWAFYDPENIGERQRRWAEEVDEDDEPWDEPGETYVRETPKIGRNDPCPCGSGKKYKKCCLPEEA